jgi:CRISPR-associated protein Cmr2
MYDDGSLETDKSDYPLFETIWRDMVDLYDFIAASEDDVVLESELATMEVES